MRAKLPSWSARIAGIRIVPPGAAVLLCTEKPSLAAHPKAYYLDPKQVSIVRPCLVTKITGARIAPDGTITAQISLTDPTDVALDKDSVTTPGAVSISLISAYIPADAPQYVNYTARTQTDVAPSRCVDIGVMLPVKFDRGYHTRRQRLPRSPGNRGDGAADFEDSGRCRKDGET